MKFSRSVQAVLRLFLVAFIATLIPVALVAAPYAAVVMDARSGKILHARNADTRLHPASLTKMMTLYVVFDAIERGDISLDTKVRISKNAAAEPPSKLGLRAGQSITLKYLIRAAAVKSANDAATALGEAVSGSEAAFARRMNRMAKALGMTRTTFRNAHGLTESGHLSTARDMTLLGRHLFYDFPEYYNLFSRRTTDAGVKKVSNTNRRLLGNYRGADGIKTGYTRAAGFNLVASAERGSERIIATVFGGRSSTTRNARVAELLDMGFQRAPTRVAVKKPRRPAFSPEGTPVPTGPTVNASGLVAQSLRPRSRPLREEDKPSEDVLIAMQSSIANVLAEVAVAKPAAETTETATASLVPLASVPGTSTPTARPSPRPKLVAMTTAEVTRSESSSPVVITRLSSSGGRHWGINVGRFSSRHLAEKVLLQTALSEISTLDEALRKVVPRKGGFDANFVGLSEEKAEMACRRLLARNQDCTPVGPS